VSEREAAVRDVFGIELSAPDRAALRYIASRENVERSMSAR
jgi:hypothetical protein